MPLSHDQKKSYQLLACPRCGASALSGKQACAECGGLQLAAWDGTHLFYFGREINSEQDAENRIRRAVKVGVNFLLLIFFAAGLAALGWHVYDLFQSNFPIWKFYQVKDPRLLGFWFSLLTDGFLYFRLQRDQEIYGYVPKRSYEPAAGALTDIDWAGIKLLPKNKRIDISRFFSIEALAALDQAYGLAKKYENQAVEPVHLFIALLAFEKTQIIFSRLGVPFSGLKSRLSGVIARQAPLGRETAVFGPRTLTLIFDAYFLAYQMKLPKVDLTELLETLVLAENEVKELLYDLNITGDKVANVAAWLRINRQLRLNWQRFRRKAVLRPKSTMNRAMTAVATPVLDAFGQDMTMLARYGYLAPCVGRQREFEEIFGIMAGGARRSLILVGNPGVGKNTIIEGLAQRMVEDDVPEFLRDKRLVSLSLAKLTSGADAAGAQERLMRVMYEIRRSGNVVLYISDIQNMVGLTAGRQGSIDLADVLSQALAKNTFLCLSTTTPSDYRRYLEDKSSLDRVLEKVMIEEVSGNEAIQILESKANTIEHRHQVFFSYDAVAEAVSLANRYLHDRFLPEKAIQIMEEVAARVREKKGKNSLIVGNDVAAVISEKTNVPLTEITQEESAKLLHLEAKIHERMIGQEEAVSLVATSLRRARAEMRDIKRPIVTLLFLGPTGVGKTELAKTVAAVYFGDEKNMIRLDMSEYQDQSSLNRLIGAPPGYAGNESGGYLTEAVRKNPFSLLLLDEIEKAHPDILNIFLQVTDDGRLTDGGGRTVDFTNTIIIATSNAGTNLIQDLVKQNVPLAEIRQRLLDQELGRYFRPEFLNRFDGVVVFKPLSMAEVEAIARLMLLGVAQYLEEKGIKLEISPEAVSDLARAGFDPQFGARPLRRVIQQTVQDQLANYILAGQIKRRDTVKLEAGPRISVIKAQPL